MQIRRFSPEIKSKLPGGHPGVYAVPVQMNKAVIPADRLETLAERAHGLPLLLATDTVVIAMYFEKQASIDEHRADHPILFLVTAGEGKVRIGGPDGETALIRAGEAVLWPAEVDHTVWTEESSLEAIVIELPTEA